MLRVVLVVLLISVGWGHGASVPASSMTAADVKAAHESLAARFIQSYTMKVSVECVSGPCVQVVNISNAINTVYPSMSRVEVRVDGFGRTITGYPTVDEGLVSLTSSPTLEFVNETKPYWVANQLVLNYSSFTNSSLTAARLASPTPRFASYAGRLSMEGLLYTLRTFMAAHNMPATTAFDPATLSPEGSTTRSYAAVPPMSTVSASLADASAMDGVAFGNFTNVSYRLAFVGFVKSQITTPTRTSELVLPSSLLVTEMYHTYFYNTTSRSYEEITGGMYTSGNTTNVWNVSLADYAFKAVDDARLQKYDALLRAATVSKNRQLITANYSVEMVGSCTGGGCPTGSYSSFPYPILGLEVNRSVNADGTVVSESFLRLVDGPSRTDITYLPNAIKQAKTSSELFALATYALLLPPTSSLAPILYRPDTISSGQHLYTCPYPTVVSANVDEEVGRVTSISMEYRLRIVTVPVLNTSAAAYYGDLSSRSWVFTGNQTSDVAPASLYPFLLGYDRMPTPTSPLGDVYLSTVQVVTPVASDITVVASNTLQLDKYVENTTGYVSTPLAVSDGGYRITLIVILIVLIVGTSILAVLVVLWCVCRSTRKQDPASDEEMEDPPVKPSTYNARNKSIMYNQGRDNYPTAVRPPSHRAEPSGTAQHPYGANGEPYAPAPYGQPVKPLSSNTGRSRSAHTSSPRSDGSPTPAQRQDSPTRTPSARASPTRPSSRRDSEPRGSESPLDRRVLGGSQPSQGGLPPDHIPSQTHNTPPITTSPQRGGPNSRSSARSSQERTQWSRAHRGSPDRRADDGEPQVSRVLSDANCSVSPARVHFSN